MPATIPIQQILALTIAYYLVKKVKKKQDWTQAGISLSCFKKVYIFCGIYCRIILKSGSSNVFVLKIKVDFGLQNIVFFRYSNEKDNIQTGLLWTNGVI